MKKLTILAVVLSVSFTGAMIQRFKVFKHSEDMDIIKLELGDTLTLDKKYKKYEIDEDSLIKANGFPKVGEYLLNASYHSFFLKKTHTIKVIVKDTTPPLIQRTLEDIIFQKGEKIDLDKYFIISDYSDFDISYELEALNIYNPGIYTSTIIVSDRYDNISSLSFDITIIENEQISSKPRTDIIDKSVESDNDATKSKNNSVSTISPTYKDGYIIVNKKNPVPSNFIATEDPEALSSLKQLIDVMKENNLNIDDSYSGYRSISYQEQLYNNYVAKYGKQEADTFSAKPGYSEHHTGLAFDLKHKDKSLIENHDEVDFISKNAHKFGFIVRYQKGKEHITGYIHEPWHLRYVGDIAHYLYENDLTLEEYLNIDGGDYLH